MGIQGIGFRVEGIGDRDNRITNYGVPSFTSDSSLRHFFHCRFAALP
jgi:hypothetical protein